MQRLAICGPVLAAIDAAGDGVEFVLVGQCVQPSGRPEPCGRQAGMLWFLKQFGVVDEVEAECFAAVSVVGAAGDLDQATTAIFGAIARYGVAQICAAFVSGLGRGRAPDFSYVLEVSGLVADLGDEGGHAFHADNLEAVHGCVQER